MVETPSENDRTSGQVNTGDNSSGRPTEVEALLENTPDDIGYMYPKEDPLDDDLQEQLGVSPKDLVEAINELDVVIKDKLTEIVTKHREIYTTAFGNFYLLTGDWTYIFGHRPPSSVDSWGPIWDYGNERLKATYQMNAENGRDHTPSLERFEDILDDFSKKVLPVRITPALALSEVGNMTLPQAQAYILDRWDYSLDERNELLQQDLDTGNARLVRGNKKALQAAWMGDFVKTLSETKPVDYNQILDRVGKTYKTQDGYKRVTGIYDDDGELVYELASIGDRERVPVEYFSSEDSLAGHTYTEWPTSEAPEPLKEVSVMDTSEFPQ